MSLKLRGQTDEQLRLALRSRLLESKERRQIEAELCRRDLAKRAAETAAHKDEREKQDNDLAAFRQLCKAMPDDELTARCENPANLVEQLAIRDEIARRATNAEARAIKAAHTAFSAMTYDELLKWTPSFNDVENRAAAKELRARIDLLERKLIEVKHGGDGLKTVGGKPYAALTFDTDPEKVEEISNAVR